MVAQRGGFATGQAFGRDMSHVHELDHLRVDRFLASGHSSLVPSKALTPAAPRAGTCLSRELRARAPADAASRTDRARLDTALAASPPRTDPGDSPPSRSGSSDTLFARHAQRRIDSSGSASGGSDKGHVALAPRPSGAGSRSRPEPRAWKCAPGQPGNQCLAPTPPLQPACGTGKRNP